MAGIDVRGYLERFEKIIAGSSDPYEQQEVLRVLSQWRWDDDLSDDCRAWAQRLYSLAQRTSRPGNAQLPAGNTFTSSPSLPRR